MEIDFICGDHNYPQCAGLFGGWLTSHQGLTFMVDCGIDGGGASLAAKLKKRLGRQGLDYVLLTHIHLDHAGGLAAIFDAFPQARAVVHARGLKHLAVTDRLWADTQRVMGELASTYGPVRPLAESRLIPHTKADIPGLVIYETPGHAPHHLSFNLGGVVFVGEAAGDPFEADGRVYGRAATPGRYFPETVAASIEKLLALPDGPAYFAHTTAPLSLHSGLLACRRQLALWDEYLRPRTAPRPGESRPEQLERLCDELFTADPDLAALPQVSPRTMWVEKFFVRNSIAGFLAHYESGESAMARRASLATG